MTAAPVRVAGQQVLLQQNAIVTPLLVVQIYKRRLVIVSVIRGVPGPVFGDIICTYI